MTTKQQVLMMLEENRGDSISGEALAAAFGVGRNAVWKAVCALKKEGYRIDSVPNRGYCLLFDNDVLSEAGISRYLTAQGYPLSLLALPQVTSTNTLLKAEAENGAPAWRTIVAAEQTAGRGRRGRTFYSPKAHGVYLSVLLKPALAAADALSITTAAAVAVCRAIERISHRTPSIKWVNDVYAGGKKLCGILTEASIDLESGGLHYAILGIGVNISDPDGGFPEELTDIATSIYQDTPCPPDTKNRLVAAILSEFCALYPGLGKKAHMDAYRDYSFVVGKHVDVIAGEIHTPALVTGIDDDAHLVVQYKNGETGVLSSGEISIRPIQS